MTIFLTGTIADTADDLDIKRFNKQIVECQWMINMSEGKTKPSNHPAYLMYKDHIEWVKNIKNVLLHIEIKILNYAKHYLKKLKKYSQVLFVRIFI